METWNKVIHDAIRRYVRYEHGGVIKKAAQELGVKYETFKSWHDEVKSPTLESLSPCMEKLGFPLPRKATIRRTGANSPAEIVDGDGLCAVPVLGAAGAGGAVEFFATEPETVIQVMEQYAISGVVALHIEGDSMEPTIRKGSYVGVVPMEGKIIEGNIYLVDLPHLGRVVKRIRMRSDGRLEMYSDNPKFEPHPLPDDGYEHIIVGRVVWIWQLC